MHLGAFVQVLSTPTTTLTFTLTQTDLSIGTPGVLLFETAGGGSGPGSVSWGTYVDSTNAAFGLGTSLLQCGGYSCSTSNSSQSLTAPYSATIQAVFDYRTAVPITGGSLDLNLKTIPEPSSIALAGLALLGLGFARRRKA
jgi:hypothetical protein